MNYTFKRSTGRLFNDLKNIDFYTYDAARAYLRKWYKHHVGGSFEQAHPTLGDIRVTTGVYINKVAA